MNKDQFVIGTDYGSDSVRSVLIDARNGEEIASSVFSYPRWADGLYCKASENQFRQHPLDYIEGLEFTVKDCLAKAGGKSTSRAVKGLSIDTTGSLRRRLINRVRLWRSLRVLKTTPMPCLFYGKIMFRFAKRRKSMNTPPNLTATTLNM